MSADKPKRLGLPAKPKAEGETQAAPRKPVRPPANRQAAMARKPAVTPQPPSPEVTPRKSPSANSSSPSPRRARPSTPQPDRPTRDPRPVRNREEEDPLAPLRLSKRLAELGLCSRREADDYIARGWVTVDGEVINELGSKVFRSQAVALNRKAAAAQDQRVTILLHKPIGYVSGQAEDGYQPAIVLVKPDAQWSSDPSSRHFDRAHLRGLAPAGRLDIDSTGLLVLTQDGRVARQLIGDDSEIEKEYLVRVEGRLSDEGLSKLNHGLSLDGMKLRRAQVEWQNEDQLRFVLKEGRKRQIRRMCELVGLKVVGLKRVRIGKVMLGNLPQGQWRYLGEDESF